MPDTTNTDQNNLSDKPIADNSLNIPAVPSTTDNNLTPPATIPSTLPTSPTSSTLESVPPTFQTVPVDTTASADTSVSSINSEPSNPSSLSTSSTLDNNSDLLNPNNATNNSVPQSDPSTTTTFSTPSTQSTLPTSPTSSTLDNNEFTPNPFSPPPKPRSSKKTVVLIAVATFLAIAIPATVFLVKQNQNLQQKADSSPICENQCTEGQTMCQGEGATLTGYLCDCVNVSPTGCYTGTDVWQWRCQTWDPQTCPADERPPGDYQCQVGSGAKIVGRCIEKSGDALIPVVYKYTCPGKMTSEGGCQENEKIIRNTDSVCFDDNFCGAQQIDLPEYTQCFISVVDHNCSSSSPPPDETPQPSPSTIPSPSPGGQCQNLKIYKVTNVTDAATWTQVADNDLPKLKAGDVIYATVLGEITNGTVDKARIRVNSTTWTAENETTNKKPGSQEYYIMYTIPTNNTNFTFGAEVHESTQNKWY